MTTFIIAYIIILWFLYRLDVNRDMVEEIHRSQFKDSEERLDKIKKKHFNISVICLVILVIIKIVLYLCLYLFSQS